MGRSNLLKSFATYTIIMTLAALLIEKVLLSKAFMPNSSYGSVYWSQIIKQGSTAVILLVVVAMIWVLMVQRSQSYARIEKSHIMLASMAFVVAGIVLKGILKGIYTWSDDLGTVIVFSILAIGVIIALFKGRKRLPEPSVMNPGLRKRFRLQSSAMLFGSCAITALLI